MTKKRQTSKKSKEGFRGTFEPQVAKILSHFKRKYKYDAIYESETFEISIPKTYTPDFVLEYPDGRKKIIECKGYFPDEDRRKCLAFRKAYPDIEYLIVFQRDNSLYKGSKIKYSDWCFKNGIDCAIGTIPEEWLQH